MKKLVTFIFSLLILISVACNSAQSDSNTKEVSTEKNIEKNKQLMLDKAKALEKKTEEVGKEIDNLLKDL